MNHEQQAMKLFDTAESIARAYSYAERSTLHAPRSSGIALVMVLGVLSVMVIMAVAFAISMRTERVAAGNYADSVRARQLVQVGLARALNDLAGNLGPTGLYQPDGKAYPNWTVTNSYTNAYTNTSVNVYLVFAADDSTRANEATNFVPRVLWTAATNADYRNATNHWLPLDSIVTYMVGTTNMTNSTRMGRVKYLILNCSGLLDANFVGGAARGVGTDPSELAVQQLGELPTAPTDFFFNRNSHVRYETLDELAVLNNFQPTNFCVYSHCPVGYWATNPAPVGVRTQVNLAGTAADMSAGSLRWHAITNAFYLAGFDGSEAGVLYRNLVDYIDADSVPTNLMSKCVEAVPMINEIVVSNVVTNAGGGDSTMDTTIYFELWYPFVRDSADTFELQYKATFLDLGGAGFVPPNVIAWQSLAPPIGTPGAQSFTVRSDSLSLPPQPAGVVKFKSTIDARVVLVVGMADVDRVDSLELTSENVGFGESVVSAECIDPRFNAYPAQWTNAPSHSLGNTNTCTINWWHDNPDFDTNAAMYVANTDLHSVGELGYLAYAPWKTVKLYGQNLNPVLDYFAIGTNATDVYVTHPRRGLVNPNSSETNALAAVFAEMPVDEYPGGPSNRLSMASALAIAEHLYTGGFYTNLSDIGRGVIDFNSLTDMGGTPISVSSELQRESFFRNTCGLFNLRQNLFTIIIEAHVASGGNIPRNPVKQRAVALVWRDPYTGEMFVRSIKWLRD